MNVLVDTSIWSLALRRDESSGKAEMSELTELIREGRVAMIGAIRQELLSGIRVEEQYKKLRDRLRKFADIQLNERDYEDAASCFNRCRTKGLQGSNTDFLICALSIRHGLSIFTTDRDFAGFKKILGLKLHQIR